MILIAARDRALCKIFKFVFQSNFLPQNIFPDLPQKLIGGGHMSFFNIRGSIRVQKLNSKIIDNIFDRCPLFRLKNDALFLVLLS